MSNSEKGISQIIILVLLLVGIVTGVYLVQQTQILKPKAASSTTITINSSPTVCSTTQTGMQTVSASWAGIDNVSAYGVTLYQLGDNIRKNVGSDCLGGGANNYSFKGQFPISFKYEVAVVAYSPNHGNCQYGSITAATSPVTNQTSCVIPGALDCSTLAVLNKTFNLYTQKNCTAITAPKCVATGEGKNIAVYECKSDDGKCIDLIRPIAEAYRCAAPGSAPSSDD